MDTGHDGTWEHIHDRPASFARGLGLHGDVPAAAADAVMDSEGAGEGRANEQEQRNEGQYRFSHFGKLSE